MVNNALSSIFSEPASNQQTSSSNQQEENEPPKKKKRTTEEEFQKLNALKSPSQIAAEAEAKKANKKPECSLVPKCGKPWCDNKEETARIYLKKENAQHLKNVPGLVKAYKKLHGL